jgi:hypothetical protein
LDFRGIHAREDPGVPRLALSGQDNKEGVDGSSPSEGLRERPNLGLFNVFSRREGLRGLNGTVCGAFASRMRVRTLEVLVRLAVVAYPA